MVGLEHTLARAYMVAICMYLRRQDRVSNSSADTHCVSQAAVGAAVAHGLYKLSRNQSQGGSFSLAYTIIRLWFFYHADPHPGNLLCTPEGKLAYLDAPKQASCQQP